MSQALSPADGVGEALAAVRSPLLDSVSSQLTRVTDTGAMQEAFDIMPCRACAAVRADSAWRQSVWLSEIYAPDARPQSDRSGASLSLSTDS